MPKKLKPKRLSPTDPDPPMEIGETSIKDHNVWDILTDRQRKYPQHEGGNALMYPGAIAQQHTAGPMLTQWGTTGCPVAIEKEWSLDQLDQAVAYGAHPSAREPVAAKALNIETMDKVTKGFASIMRWSQLRKRLLKAPPRKNPRHHNRGQKKRLPKISPCAAIPHKSRLFRLLLDLSDKGQRRKGMDAKPSVNTLTDEEAAPTDSMQELGNALPRCIHAMATWPEEDGPIKMVKYDIQDGFWRMDVNRAQREQFCYVLPPDPDAPYDPDPIIVIPRALQMGWVSSPAFFCAATETGRDIAEYLYSLDSLPEHQLEHHALEPMKPGLLRPEPEPPPQPRPSRKRRRLEDVIVG